MSDKESGGPDQKDATKTNAEINTADGSSGSAVNFPAGIADDALCGIAGDIVDLIYQDSEATREALLAQFLVGVGNLMGRKVQMHQAGMQHCNEFVAVVGGTADRKGTSLDPLTSLFREVDLIWSRDRKIKGVASGEALIHGADDAVEEGPDATRPKEKRSLIIEQEFSRLLAVSSRAGNTLSQIIRDAYDTGDLDNKSKQNPASVRDVHISAIAHVTQEDLKACLQSADVANGFANRFLWCATKRSKTIPRPKQIIWHKTEAVEILKEVVKWAKKEDRFMEWEEIAGKAWDAYYFKERSALEKRSGYVAKLSSRQDVHTLRLAMIYAALDKSRQIRIEHLKAAIAVTDYSLRSIKWIFGDSTGSSAGDRLLAWLKRYKITARKQISEYVFSKNSDTATINSTLETLRLSGVIDFVKRKIGKASKPTTFWFLRSCADKIDELIGGYDAIEFETE